MILVLEIAAGVAAGLIVGFFVLANWNSIVEAIEQIAGFVVLILILAGISSTLAWLIDVVKGTTPTVDQLNLAAGSIMGGVMAVGVLIYLSINVGRSVRNFHRFVRKRMSGQ